MISNNQQQWYDMFVQREGSSPRIWRNINGIWWKYVVLQFCLTNPHVVAGQHTWGRISCKIYSSSNVWIDIHGIVVAKGSVMNMKLSMNTRQKCIQVANEKQDESWYPLLSYHCWRVCPTNRKNRWCGSEIYHLNSANCWCPTCFIFRLSLNCLHSSAPWYGAFHGCRGSRSGRRQGRPEGCCGPSFDVGKWSTDHIWPFATLHWVYLAYVHTIVRVDYDMDLKLVLKNDQRWWLEISVYYGLLSPTWGEWLNPHHGCWLLVSTVKQMCKNIKIQ